MLDEERAERTYFATPVASVLAVDEEGVVWWVLEALLAVPVGGIVVSMRFR